jgi:hypothetical protein
MDFWRRLARVSRKDKILNYVIRVKICLQNSVLDCLKTKLIWYGHIQRMADNRWPKQVLEWLPPGRRQVGRPRVRWIGGIQDAVADRGLEGGHRMDREEW